MALSIRTVEGTGGVHHAVLLADLPEPVRLAYLRRELDGLHLDPGTYDDAAHVAMAEAVPTRRARAERKAAIARMLVALLAKGVANREGGRRSQGARGRSYEDVFRAGLESRVVRKPTARQLYLSGLIWKPVAVDRFAQVHRDGWIYGGPVTQEALLRFHGKGQRILLRRDPHDFSSAAIVYNEDGRLICEGTEPVKRGAYGSVEGIRQSARNRKAARTAEQAAETANNYQGADAFDRALAALEGPQDAPAAPPQKVVAGRFGSPLRETAPPRV